MKKKIYKSLIIITAILLVYNFILFPTGLFVIYHKNPTTANEPGIPFNARMISTNLVDYNLLDFIVFDQKDSFFSGGERVFRLIAMEGDTIHIRNGVVFRNSENIDSKLVLKHMYFTNITIDYKSFSYSNDYGEIGRINDSTYVITLKDNDTLLKNKNFQRYIVKREDIDPEIQKMYSSPWNKDHFGPLIIPKGKLFVLGDNRGNSLDSRFIGLIDKENVVGTILLVF